MFGLVVLAGGLWLLLDDRSGWRQWLSDEAALLWPQVQRLAVGQPAPAGLSVPESSSNSPAAPITAATAPEARSQEPAETAVVAYAAPEPLPAPGGAAAPLPSAAPPPAEPSPGDALQRQAEAAGLHPGISRALLARLTAADFQNVATAIRTALAETPDDGELVWPRQRKPELALFKVHFVPGAPSDCRRYVVTVTKDGWSTTALPMERCGIRPRRAQRS